MTDSSAFAAQFLARGEGAGLSRKDAWRGKSAAQAPSPLWGGPGRGAPTSNLPLTEGGPHHG